MHNLKAVNVGFKTIVLMKVQSAGNEAFGSFSEL